eukprot:SAG31_NODE_1430_length_8385_cov_3.096186_9_plen_246_part_00
MLCITLDLAALLALPLESGPHSTTVCAPQHPDLIRLTGKHPFNCEPPLDTLHAQGFITPPSLHYVRNHGTRTAAVAPYRRVTAIALPMTASCDLVCRHAMQFAGVCPKLTWEEHKLVINGLVAAPLEISMDELAEMPSVTLPVLLVCAGNRRKEQNMIKQTIGFHWGAAGLANGMWTGVRLSHLLEKAGYDTHKARHVEFIGVEDLPNKQDGTETKCASSESRISLTTQIYPCLPPTSAQIWNIN